MEVLRTTVQNNYQKVAVLLGIETGLGSALLRSLRKTCRVRKGQQVWAMGAVTVHLLDENSFCFCSLSYLTNGQMTVC